MQADGVGAQAEDEANGDVFRHREADRTEHGDAEGDRLADQQQFGEVAGGIGVDGLDSGFFGLGAIAAGGVQEHRREKADNEVHQISCLGHAWLGVEVLGAGLAQM